jgi:hypothetical protein
MPRPKILHIMECANLGGMEKATLELRGDANAPGASGGRLTRITTYARPKDRKLKNDLNFVSLPPFRRPFPFVRPSSSQEAWRLAPVVAPLKVRNSQFCNGRI